MAAIRARTRAGSVTLVNPRPPVARMLNLLCVEEVFAIRGQGLRDDKKAADVVREFPS